MNYLMARQLRQGGWHFTAMRDQLVWAIGYCREHGPHFTQEEAERCFHKYELDNAHFDARIAPHTQHLCEFPGCRKWTQMGARWGWGGVGHLTLLCDEHRNREGLEQAHPFMPGMEVITS